MSKERVGILCVRNRPAVQKDVGEVCDGCRPKSSPKLAGRDGNKLGSLGGRVLFGLG